MNNIGGGGGGGSSRQCRSPSGSDICQLHVKETLIVDERNTISDLAICLQGGSVCENIPVVPLDCTVDALCAGCDSSATGSSSAATVERSTGGGPGQRPSALQTHVL